MFDPNYDRVKEVRGYKVVVDSCELVVDFVRFREQVLESIYGLMKRNSQLKYPINRLSLAGPWQIPIGSSIFKVSLQ